MSARPNLRLVPGTDAGPDAPPTPRRRDAIELAATGVGLTLAMSLIAALPSWREELPRTQALMLVAFGFHALALWRMRRWRGLPFAGAAIFAVALSARLALLPAAPTLSDDIHRYVWEGRVLASGHDPWALPPNDPALAALRDAVIHPQVNHPALASIYPPVAMLGFALVAAWSPTVAAMKVWILAHDLALVVLLLLLARRWTGSALPAIAYAWNPLVLLEYAGNGHHDPTGIVWLVAALALASERPWLSAGALVLGVGVKLAPLLALPFLWSQWPGRVRVAALAGCTATLGALAWLARGSHSGLGAYAASWRNNDLAFGPILAVFGSQAAARGVALVLLAAVIVVLLHRGVPWLRGARESMRAGLLLGPVVHPWYLGWALAFEPFGPSAPWWLLSLTSLLAYGVFAVPHEGGAFHLGAPWRAVEYGLPFLLFVVLALRARRTRLRRV